MPVHAGEDDGVCELTPLDDAGHSCLQNTNVAICDLRPPGSPRRVLRFQAAFKMTTTKNGHGHGGRRPGAGRKAGGRNAATIAQKKTFAEIAKEHAPAALDMLAKIAASSESDSARVAACNSILDRAYGKPPQFSTANHADFRRATEMTDDELASIAAGGSRDPASAEDHPPVTH